MVKRRQRPSGAAAQILYFIGALAFSALMSMMVGRKVGMHSADDRAMDNLAAAMPTPTWKQQPRHRFCPTGKQFDLCASNPPRWKSLKKLPYALAKTLLFSDDKVCWQLQSVVADNWQDCRNFEKAFQLLSAPDSKLNLTTNFRALSWEIRTHLQPGTATTASLPPNTFYLVAPYLHPHSRALALADFSTIRRILDDADVLLDLGSGPGLFSLAAASMHPTLQTVAFEPQPLLYLLLRHNAQINGLDHRIRAINKAVTARGGDVTVAYDEVNLFGRGVVHLNDIPFSARRSSLLYFPAKSLTPIQTVQAYTDARKRVVALQKCEWCTDVALSGVPGYRVQQIKGEAPADPVVVPAHPTVLKSLEARLQGMLFSCATGGGMHCKTCMPQSQRLVNNHCETCNSGYMIAGDVRLTRNTAVRSLCKATEVVVTRPQKEDNEDQDDEEDHEADDDSAREAEDKMIARTDAVLPEFSVHEGVISATGDLFEGQMTVVEAMQRCKDLQGECRGFYHRGPPTTESVLIYGKNKFDLHTYEAQGEWTSYRFNQEQVREGDTVTFKRDVLEGVTVTFEQDSAKADWHGLEKGYKRRTFSFGERAIVAEVSADRRFFTGTDYRMLWAPVSAVTGEGASAQVFACATASSGLACRTCRKQDKRTEDNQCLTCNSGYRLVDDRCEGFGCATLDEGSACATCEESQWKRTTDNHCKTCNVGYKLFGTSCVKDESAETTLDDFLPSPRAGYETSVVCKGSEMNRSCAFRNLYWWNGTWHIFLLATEVEDTEATPLGNLKVSLASRVGAMMIPKVKRFSSVAEITQFVETENFRTLPKLTVAFDMPHAHTGHALWDGLYPAFLALMRFGIHKHLFRVLANIAAGSGKMMWESVIDTFGGYGLQYLRDLRKDQALRLELAVMGCGNMGQHHNNAAVAMHGGREFDATRVFRDRMYSRHGLPLGRHNDDTRKKDATTIIVDNQLFDPETRRALQGIQNLDGLHVKYVTWDTRSFLDALRLLRDVAVHVSSVGTSQMYQNFLRDGSVHVNLGTVESARQSPFPLYMEQNLAEGAPYIRALYYNPAKRLCGIDAEEVVRLIKEAQDIFKSGFEIPVPVGANLSPEGLVFKELCERSDCKDLLMSMNADGPTSSFMGACYTDSWVEYVVYEQGAWASDGWLGQRCPVDRELLHRLKRHYAAALAPSLPLGAKVECEAQEPIVLETPCDCQNAQLGDIERIAWKDASQNCFELQSDDSLILATKEAGDADEWELSANPLSELGQAFYISYTLVDSVKGSGFGIEACDKPGLYLLHGPSGLSLGRPASVDHAVWRVPFSNAEEDTCTRFRGSGGNSGMALTLHEQRVDLSIHGGSCLTLRKSRDGGVPFKPADATPTHNPFDAEQFTVVPIVTTPRAQGTHKYHYVI